MVKLMRVVAIVGLLVAGVLVPSRPARGQVGRSSLLLCQDLAFSTEEDFVTQGPEPPDGNPVVSDGDLLGPNCVICARNRELLQVFQVSLDLGLDAADILDAEAYLAAFSTELDSPNAGQFAAGDLLVTNGAIIPNVALLDAFKLPRYDLGLDAVHFVGALRSIMTFLSEAAKISRTRWLEAPSMLAAMLRQYEIDIWFSTEGTAPTVTAPLFLDGDVLSAARCRCAGLTLAWTLWQATAAASRIPSSSPRRSCSAARRALPMAMSSSLAMACRVRMARLLAALSPRRIFWGSTPCL